MTMPCHPCKNHTVCAIAPLFAKIPLDPRSEIYGNLVGLGVKQKIPYLLYLVQGGMFWSVFLLNILYSHLHLPLFAGLFIPIIAYVRTEDTPVEKDLHQNWADRMNFGDVSARISTIFAPATLNSFCRLFILQSD